MTQDTISVRAGSQPTTYRRRRARKLSPTHQLVAVVASMFAAVTGAVRNSRFAAVVRWFVELTPAERDRFLRRLYKEVDYKGHRFLVEVALIAFVLSLFLAAVVINMICITYILEHCTTIPWN